MDHPLSKTAALLIALAAGWLSGALYFTATSSWASGPPSRPEKLGDIRIVWVAKADTADLECYIARPPKPGKERGVWLCG